MKNQCPLRRVLAAARIMCVAVLTQLAAVNGVRAQIQPGPYELLPFEDGFIIEAFKDLLAGTGNADWSGVAAASWVSPNAYNEHTGTDFALQTGTPLYAAAAGMVTQTETSFARDQTGSTLGLGNFVRIAVDAAAPNGEALNLVYGHMLSVAVTVGQRVDVGDLVGLSDNNGNSTSEHLHLQSEIQGGAATCPFYWAHFKYPIMFNPNGTHQIGGVVRVAAASTPIRTDRFDSSAQISTAWRDQLFFFSYPKRGYYQVFIPNNTSYRSGWLRATDVEEVFTGTVIQALPDNLTYVHSGQLQTEYAIRSAPDDGAGQLGQIVFGGGRFVADQITNGYYRIPLPGGAATWGWVKPGNRMVVYPQLTNPALNLAALPSKDFPIRESFSTLGKSTFGRPKFKRSEVKAFSPASPGGEGKALFLTDEGNHGQGICESALVGRPGHRNYFVQSHVYFNYVPAGPGWERYGIFLRDDGFAGLSTTFEGAGNCYALLWDTDDGRLRACKIVDATMTDFLSPARYVTGSGWRAMRIEARENKIKYFLDGQLLIETTDSTFPSGQCGLGYATYRSDWPVTRGAYFDNFWADTLEPPRFTEVKPLPGGNVSFQLTGYVGATNIVERAAHLTNWQFFTNVIVGTNGTGVFVDEATPSQRFYRAYRQE
jgi:murein DD-endopeptidase MepM/ murein hydrolase activator NlpD